MGPCSNRFPCNLPMHQSIAQAWECVTQSMYHPGCRKDDSMQVQKAEGIGNRPRRSGTSKQLFLQASIHYDTGLHHNDTGRRIGGLP